MIALHQNVANCQNTLTVPTQREDLSSRYLKKAKHNKANRKWEYARSNTKNGSVFDTALSSFSVAGFITEWMRGVIQVGGTDKTYTQGKSKLYDQNR